MYNLKLYYNSALCVFTPILNKFPNRKRRITMFEPIIASWNSIVEFFNDYIVFPIVNISVINILDIVLLWYLIYTLYKFVKVRHAWRILTGIIFLFFMYGVSEVLGMVAINTILKTLYTAGIVAICIIFQPELRDMLEEFGATASSNIKKITNKQNENTNEILTAVEEVSAAAFELSSKGEGALIVLERAGRLRNQMSEGTPIDAVVSRQLLCNIFVNRSPLHDGAVIIRNCRIVAASCKSKTIAEDDDAVAGLGTRHRAALRISEVSDAVVVVVSEETGNISIANNRLLKRDYNDIGQGGLHKSNDLRDDLYKLMTGQSIEDTAAAEVKSAGKRTRKSKKGGANKS